MHDVFNQSALTLEIRLSVSRPGVVLLGGRGFRLDQDVLLCFIFSKKAAALAFLLKPDEKISHKLTVKVLRCDFGP